jgi:hypothetical protein
MTRAAPLALLALAAAACRHDNPPVTRAIAWDSPRTAELAARACMDCHSNETHWPWTSYVPGIGWLVTTDVHRARCHMNLSEWDGPNEDAWDAPDEIRDGDMPLGLYTAAHRDARLTDSELEELAAGFERTFAADPPLPGEPCEDRDDRDDRVERDDDRARRAAPTRRAPPPEDRATLRRLALVAVAAGGTRALDEGVAALIVDGSATPYRGRFTSAAGRCALRLDAEAAGLAFITHDCAQTPEGWRVEGALTRDGATAPATWRLERPAGPADPVTGRTEHGSVALRLIRR